MTWTSPDAFSRLLGCPRNRGNIKVYAYGLQRISIRDVAAGVHYYGYDAHSGVRLLTDASGAVTDTWDYDAFGNLISRTGTTANDFTYRGEQMDPTLGFQYLRARWMDPSRGRFWTVDPLAFSEVGTTPLPAYSYAAASPVDYRDPSGLVLIPFDFPAARVLQSLKDNSISGPIYMYLHRRPEYIHVHLVDILPGDAQDDFGTTFPTYESTTVGPSDVSPKDFGFDRGLYSKEVDVYVATQAAIDAGGGRKTQLRSDDVMVHELVHALQYVVGGYRPDFFQLETVPYAVEYQYRLERGVSPAIARAGYSAYRSAMFMSAVQTIDFASVSGTARNLLSGIASYSSSDSVAILGQ